MSRLAALLVACLLVGCGQPAAPEPEVSDEAKALVTKFQAERIDSSVDTFVRKNKRMPNEAEFLEIAIGPPDLGKDRSENDQWGTPFRLDRSSESSWAVRSAGPDKKFDTDDDVRVADESPQP